MLLSFNICAIGLVVLICCITIVIGSRFHSENGVYVFGIISSLIALVVFIVSGTLLLYTIEKFFNQRKHTKVSGVIIVLIIILAFMCCLTAIPMGIGYDKYLFYNKLKMAQNITLSDVDILHDESYDGYEFREGKLAFHYYGAYESTYECGEDQSGPITCFNEYVFAVPLVENVQSINESSVKVWLVSTSPHFQMEFNELDIQKLYKEYDGYGIRVIKDKTLYYENPVLLAAADYGLHLAPNFTILALNPVKSKIQHYRKLQIGACVTGIILFGILISVQAIFVTYIGILYLFSRDAGSGGTDKGFS
jgi:hypothetical protein